MAVSSNADASAPVPSSTTPCDHEVVVRALGSAAGKARAARTKTAGMLVGRPDLSDEVVLKAIAERMAFEGRDASKARAVLDAALAERPVACAFMRRLVLPPPQSSLQMPIQSILRERVSSGETKGSWLSRLSPGR